MTNVLIGAGRRHATTGRQVTNVMPQRAPIGRRPRYRLLHIVASALLVVVPYTAEAVTLTGNWSGFYNWDCGEKGRADIVFRITDYGNGTLGGEATYLGGMTVLSGYRFSNAIWDEWGIDSGIVDPNGLEVSLRVPDSDFSNNNDFSGRLEGGTISGVTLNGEGCSTNFGPSGHFSITLPDSCAGDCDSDGVVTIAELILGVNILLERSLLDDCDAADRNDDGRLIVNELVAAVNSLLCNCQPCPTPRPTNTATRTPTTTPTPTQPPNPTETLPTPGQILFHEGWERAAVRRYALETEDSFDLIEGDTGPWLTADTETECPEHGPSPNFSEVIRVDGNKALRVQSHFKPESGCADNVFVGAVNIDPPSFRALDYPLNERVFFSFREQGQTTGNDECEAVLVSLVFDDRDRLTYVLQRGPAWDRRPDGSECHDIFEQHTLLLAPRGGTYVRNLLADAAAAGLRRPNRVTLISLDTDSGASATFDDIQFFLGG